MFKIVSFTPKTKYTPEAAREALAHLGQFGIAVLNRMKDYPPPAKPHFKRTGTLGRNWTMHGPMRVGNLAVVRIANPVFYAPRVQGYSHHKSPKELRQAEPWKRYGWPSIDEVAVELWESRYRKRISRALQRGIIKP